VKNVLLADDGCRVRFLSDTYEGSSHDKPIADQTPYPLPEGSQLLQDLGFVGFTLLGVQITQPHKKPPGHELTEEQKAENQAIAHRRVRIEQIICSIKRCPACQGHDTALERHGARFGDGDLLWLTQLSCSTVSLAFLSINLDKLYRRTNPSRLNVQP
jgi:DDE superfamily endonuclease